MVGGRRKHPPAWVLPCGSGEKAVIAVTLKTPWAPKLLKGKSGRRGSNPRRPAWEAGVQPFTSYSPHWRLGAYHNSWTDCLCKGPHFSLCGVHKDYHSGISKQRYGVGKGSADCCRFVVEKIAEKCGKVRKTPPARC